jgi:hypothetical protein
MSLKPRHGLLSQNEERPGLGRVVVGRFVVKLYSGDTYRTSDVDLVDTLRPEDTSLILADAACGTDIGGIYLAKPVAGGRGDKAQRLVITDVRAGVLLRARECLGGGIRAEAYVAAVEVLLPTSNP